MFLLSVLRRRRRRILQTIIFKKNVCIYADTRLLLLFARRKKICRIAGASDPGHTHTARPAGISDKQP